jgi:hypothetical protein
MLILRWAAASSSGDEHIQAGSGDMHRWGHVSLPSVVLGLLRGENPCFSGSNA